MAKQNGPKNYPAIEYREGEDGRKVLPFNITSYDLLKTFAVITMVIDHTGYYFFEDDMWWRTVGRLSFPIWAFLIGYARSRDLPLKWWACGGILLLANMIVGEGVLPLNIIFSMLFIRMLIDPVMRTAAMGFETFTSVCAILLCATIPTFVVCEYGTQGIILAMVGYLVRNKPTVPYTPNPEIVAKLFTLFALAQYFVVQALMFGMDLPQQLVLGGGLVAIYGTLYEFKPREFVDLTRKLPGFVTAVIEFMGRRTLEIYVGHLILFKILGVFTDPARFNPLRWKLINY